MKYIINGFRYDTDRADIVARYEAPYQETDLHYYYEELYIKPQGGWFLAGHGNELSRYARGPVECREPGEKVFPLLGDDEAISWLYETGNDEILNDFFPEISYG